MTTILHNEACLKRIETTVYSVSRSQLAYWTAFEYARRFWPFFISIPVTGLLISLLFQGNLYKGLGMMMILWPISIPARSILLTTKASKRAILPTKMVTEGEHVYFVTEPLSFNYRIHRDQIRDVKTRVEYVVIELWKYRFVYVPYKAFESPEAIQDFRRAVGVED
ncbi:MAG: hypothetical protein WCK51_12000 [Armatimonadota bacterium]